MRKHFSVLIILSLTFVCFQSKGQTLRSVVPAGKYIGNIMNTSFSETNDANKPLSQLSVGSDIYNQVNIVSSHFNALGMENGMKMNNILKNYDVNKFPYVTTADLNLVEVNRFVKFCNDYGMRSRGHALLWFSQVPDWLREKKPGKSDIYTFMEQYINALVGAPGVKNEIEEWDVANEMLLSGYNQYGYRTNEDDSGLPVWYANIAGVGQAGTIAYNAEMDNLLKKCFEWTKAADGAAKLFLNDYCIEDIGWTKATAAYDLVSRLRNMGASIDGVGFQSHFISNNFINGGNIIPNVILNIRKFAGLKNASNQSILVSITELDLRNDGGNMTSQQIQNAYWDVVSKSLAEPNCNMVLIWGISEKNSWIKPTFNPTPYLLWDSSYLQRGTTTTSGAWRGVYDGLTILKQNNENMLTPDSDFNFYPNPNSTNKIFVELPMGTTRLKITDTRGLTMKDIQINGEQKIDIELDITAGVYYLLCSLNSGQSYVKSLLVK